MNFIVLDLEWNQSPAGKSGEKPGIPFEIIEIGAMKLNANRQIIERFQEYVRPQVYQQMHFKTQELLHISMKELRQARSFREVIRDFLAWCGEDYVMCTWGAMDLEELQRNIEFYGMENPFPKPLFFYDVQKLFSRAYEDGHLRRSLEFAVEYLHFQKSLSFHRAIDDTYYTAMVLQKLDWKRVRAYLSVDYHRPPSCPEDEIYLRFPDYSKYVSRLFGDKEEIMEDKAATQIVCCVCGRALRKRIYWFPSGGKHYDCLAWCPEHGYLRGTIRIKKTADNRHCYAIKVVKPVDEAEVQVVREKRENLRAKKKRRKQQGA